MSPKRNPEFSSVRASDRLSLAQRRAQLLPPSSLAASGPSRATSTTPRPSVAPSRLAARTSSSSSSSSLAHGQVGLAGPSTSQRAAPYQRSDVPTVRNIRRGGVQVAEAAAVASGHHSLVQDLHRDRHAASGRTSVNSHRNTWARFHSLAFSSLRPPHTLEVLPLSSRKIIAVGALFKAGDFRSFANYLSSMKTEHLDAGHDWSPLLDHVCRWVTRSVLRGIGPARQSHPLPIALLLTLPRTTAPLVEGGFHSPVAATLLACIFLLREVELAATRVDHVTFDHPAQTVSWLLTASKTDPLAQGTSRTWGCLCEVPGLPCPYHLAVELVIAATRFADDNDWTVAAALRMPLLYTADGVTPSKAKVVETFEALARRCGRPVLSAEGLRLYGGHSARVTGAQVLAAHGIEVNKIRILARHSGDAILRYVSDAPLTTLRADLGLVGPLDSGASSSTSSTCSRALSAKLAKALDTLAKQAVSIEALRKLVTQRDAIIFVQNISTGAIHGARAGDSTHTICGWSVSPARQRRGGLRWLTTISTEPWWNLCERCLGPERQAAKHSAAASEQVLSD
jgi:hypothetical protein